MATIQRYVNTSSSGGDGTTNNTSGSTAAYSSLSSWEANVSGAATDDFIVDCCGTTADTASVTVDFATSITTGSILIRANPDDDAGKYDGTSTISTSHYRLSTSANRALYIQEKNCSINGIQISHTGNASFPIMACDSNGVFTVQNNRILNASSSGIGLAIGAALGSDTRQFINNLIVNAGTRGIELIYAGIYSNTYYLYHNTVYGDGGATGIYIDATGSGGTTVIQLKGNVCANSGGSNDINITSAGALNATITSADNAAEDATAEIQNIVPANTWTSPGTGSGSDFSVKNSSSAIYSVVNPTLVTTDIKGITRDGANHDAGAFELLTGDPALTGSATTGGHGTLGVGISIEL